MSLLWLVSLWRRDASIVDIFWAPAFFVLAVSYVWATPDEQATGSRTVIILLLSGLWALRLSGYILWRNWGESEDRRYQTIRARNQPYFALKSLFMVFWLQGVLAWIISLPLLAAILGRQSLGWLDSIALILWGVGFLFEAMGDWQLARFKADPAHQGKVMQRGLWAYTRHPNYFGNCCLWWGFFLLALSAGGWWSIIGPVLMTFLLLKVSGVSLLEQDISERRPDYRAYIERTNAFIPGPRRAA
jgi:steroid 5-alpha reductase family enzyme